MPRLKNRDRLSPSYIKRLLSPIPKEKRERYRSTLEVSGARFHDEAIAAMRHTIRNMSTLLRIQKQCAKAGLAF